MSLKNGSLKLANSCFIFILQDSVCLPVLLIYKGPYSKRNLCIPLPCLFFHIYGPDRVMWKSKLVLLTTIMWKSSIGLLSYCCWEFRRYSKAIVVITSDKLDNSMGVFTVSFFENSGIFETDIEFSVWSVISPLFLLTMRLNLFCIYYLLTLQWKTKAFYVNRNNIDHISINDLYFIPTERLQNVYSDHIKNTFTTVKRL